MPQFHSIGVLYSEFKTIENMPIQGAGVSKTKAYIIVNEQYTEGLNDLDGFSHCYLIYHLHKINNYSLSVKPFLDKSVRGIFATRSPARPNAIGLSIVRIEKVEGSKVFLTEVDILNDTPILDIKPYTTGFDEIKSEKNGWYREGRNPQETLSDERFKV